MAFLAFASPVVAALQQLARPESRAAEHHKLRSDYESLEGRIRIVDQVKYADLDKAARVERLEAFTAELHELLAKTPGDVAVPGPNPTLLTVAWRQLRRRPLVSEKD